MIEACPKCGTGLLHAAGIGDFCPNKACDVGDNIEGVSWSWAEPKATAPSERDDKLETNLAIRVGILLGVIMTLVFLWISGDVSFPTGFSIIIGVGVTLTALTLWDCWRGA